MPGPGHTAPHDDLDAFRAELAGQYRLEREIGRGGMATVWLARDLKHDRPVAIKVLRHDLAILLGRERFLREIAFAARLNHHNILPLHDSGEAGGHIYYVMPWVEHGTLSDRMRREPPPSVAEAITLARQVAEGLAHAHEVGVIHRDIKPGNILLASGHVFITDFGIARAVQAAVTHDRITETGLILGTPAYMAPEQITGSSEVDGRADQYSLACVLYEMLTGRTPASDGPGRVAEMIRAQHRDAPPSFGTAIQRALSPRVDDRFPSIEAFAGALGRPSGMSTVIKLPAAVARMVERPKWLLWGVPGVIAAVALAMLVWRPPGPPATVVDTMRFAVLPFEYAEGTERTPNLELLLQDALSRWGGITVPGAFQVRDAVQRFAEGTLNARDAGRVAARVGAGRYIRGEVTAVGDSLRIHAGLYDTRDGTQLRDGMVSIPASLDGADSGFRVLADRILLAGGTQPAGTFAGTRSFPALQAYAGGQDAVQVWNLDAADTAFAQATRFDPGYAQAWLWLTLVRAWNGTDPATWRVAAEQANANRDNLPPSDTAVVTAALAQSRGELGRACPLWRALTVRTPADFVAWYGWAVCQRADSLVVPDSRSPSRFRFRSSFHTALQAYQRSFELLPAILATLRSHSYEPVRELLRTSPTSLRAGTAEGSSTWDYMAYPSWQGDTLAFVPWPIDLVQRMEVSGSRADLAVQHQLELFHSIALTWVSNSAKDPDALEALAISLELLGNRAAMDTMARARSYASPDDWHRFAVTQARMMLRFGIPDDTAALRAAGVLVDSLLDGSPAGGDDLAALAALTGRAAKAARLARLGSGRDEWVMAPMMRSTAPALLVFSALGGPVDSLTYLEDRVVEAIGQVRTSSEATQLRESWLLRSAGIAFPNHPSPRMNEFGSFDYYLIDAELAYMNRDSAGVRAILDRVARARGSIAVIDALYPEAWLLAAVGDGPAALRWLSPALDGLATASLETFTEPVKTGTLLHAMALRAEVASRLGRTEEAARWAAAVAILWRDADPFLQPVVERMHGIQGGVTETGALWKNN